jgi:hypothetical protein
MFISFQVNVELIGLKLQVFFFFTFVMFGNVERSVSWFILLGKKLILMTGLSWTGTSTEASRHCKCILLLVLKRV